MLVRQSIEKVAGLRASFRIFRHASTRSKKCPTMSGPNANPWVSPCTHSCCWAQRDSPWIAREESFPDRMTAPPFEADAPSDNEHQRLAQQPLREKNSRKNSGYKHVPHRDKPPQVVAKRNARERRRVQAVNSAFVRLRRAVPVENSRGKRISKVKTLRNAIAYIQKLQEVLRLDGVYNSMDFPPKTAQDFFDYDDFGDDLDEEY